MSTRLRVGFALMLVTGLMSLAGTPAEAGEEKNCVALLVPVGTGTEPGAIEAELVDLGCYDTYAEALAAGSDGAIAVVGDATPQSLTQQTLDASTEPLASSVLIGTEYDGIAYGGSSASYFAPATCSSGTIWELSYVGSTWNDRFSSGKGFGGCDTNKKFRDSNFGGTVLTCTPNCSDYGSLANEVSSLRWKP